MNIIDDILRHEGWPKYTDDPTDRGGPTKGGITQKTLSDWRGHTVSPDEVRNLEEAEARDIYANRYITAPGFDGIEDESLRAQVVDTGVLQGPGWATRRLQELVGVSVDGRLGPVTLAAVNSMDARKLANRFTAARVKKLARIVANNPSQIRFLVGWMRRAVSFLET